MAMGRCRVITSFSASLADYLSSLSLSLSMSFTLVMSEDIQHKIAALLESSDDAKTIVELVKMQQQTEEGKYCSLRAIYRLLMYIIQYCYGCFVF